MQSIIDDLKSQIKNLPMRSRAREVGTVIKIADGVALLDGLSSALLGEMIIFPEFGITGLVLNLTKDNVGVVVLGDWQKIKEGSSAEATGRVFSVPVGEAMTGRVVDPTGVPLDGKGEVVSDKTSFVEKIAPGVIARKSVRDPLQTGIKAIDAMIPIGRGQRELIIGDRGTGKTSLAIDTILNQAGQNMHCVYVAIGQKESKKAKLV